MKLLKAFVAAAALLLAPSLTGAVNPAILAKKADDLAEMFLKNGARLDEAMEGLRKLNLETKLEVDNAVRKVAREGGGDLAEGWRKLLAAVADDAASLPAEADDVLRGSLAKMQQMRAAPRINGLEVAPREFMRAFSKEEKEFMALYAKRTRDSGGTVWKAADGTFLPVKECERINNLIRRVGDGRLAVSPRDAALVREAYQAGFRGTAWQQRVARLGRQRGVTDVEANAAALVDAPRVKGPADNAAVAASGDGITRATYRAAGALYDEATERALREALSQSRYEAGAKLWDLPADAEGIYKLATPELVARARVLLDSGGRVGEGMRKVAAAAKAKGSAASAAEQDFLRAWNARFGKGGAFMTPAGLMMGADESARAVKFLAKLRSMQPATGATVRAKDHFGPVEKMWLEQAYRIKVPGYRTPFLEEVRSLTDDALRKQVVSGKVNPYPTAADIEAVAPVLESRIAWQKAMLGQIDHSDRVARLNEGPVGGLTDYKYTHMAGEVRDRVRSSVSIELGNNPTAADWATTLNKAKSRAETLNPLPAKADVEHYTRAWSARVNDLEARLRKARDTLAENMHEYYKGEINSRLLRDASEFDVGGRRLIQTHENAYSGAYTSSQAEVRHLEDLLVDMRATIPEQYATRFPPVGQMDAFLAAVRAARKTAAETATEASAKAAQDAKAFADSMARVRSRLPIKEEKWVNPQTGVTETPVAIVREAVERVQLVADQMAALAKRADDANGGMLQRLSQDDPLGARHAKDAADQRLAEVARLQDEMRAATAKTNDDYAAYVNAFNDHRKAFMADAHKSYESITSSLRAQLDEVKDQLPLLQNRVGQLKHQPDMAAEFASESAKLKSLLERRHHLEDAVAKIDARIDAKVFDGNDYGDIKNKMAWVDQIYAKAKQAIEATLP